MRLEDHKECLLTCQSFWVMNERIVEKIAIQSTKYHGSTIALAPSGEIKVLISALRNLCGVSRWSREK